MIVPSSLHTNEPASPDLGRWEVAVAILIGAAVPAVILGRAVILFFVLIPALILLFRLNRETLTRFVPISGNGGLMLGAIGLTAFVWLISSALSIDPIKSLETWARTAAIALFGFLLVQQFTARPSMLDWSCKSLIAASTGVLLAANFALYIDSSIFELYKIIKGPDAILVQTLKPYSSVAICVLPIVLWAGWRLGRVWRILGLASLPLTLLLIYANGEQPGMSAAFGLVAAAVLFFGISLFKRLPRPLAWAILAAIIVLLAVGAGHVLEQLPAPPIAEGQLPLLPIPDWHRQIIWGFTAEVAKNAPFFGVGPNTVNMVPGANQIIPELNQEYIPSHPHNWPLEIAAETGMIGFLCFAATLLLWLRSLAASAIRGHGAAWPMIALYGAFWTSSLANFSIWSAWWLTVFAVLAALPVSAQTIDSVVSGTITNGNR